MKKVTGKVLLAELVGTFFLALVVILAVAKAILGSAAVFAGLVLGLMVYLVGWLSGAHLNPAITIGAWSRGMVDGGGALKYVAAQLLGARLAMIVAGAWVSRLPKLTAGTGLSLVLAEAVGTLVLAMAVAGVLGGKVSKEAAGVVVGVGMFVGANLAGVGANGIVNPAVAMALGSVSLPYLLGPIAGAVVGFWLVKALGR